VKPTDSQLLRWLLLPDSMVTPILNHSTGRWVSWIASRRNDTGFIRISKRAAVAAAARHAIKRGEL
jgi:hypothetical protein